MAGRTVVGDEGRLAERFTTQRVRLRAVAYRMLGSLSDAEDAVQETWLHVCRADRGDVANLDGWLTTVAARVCLDMLRARKARPEEPRSTSLPDPVVETSPGPEGEALLGEAVGLAMQVVLGTLDPPERLAFVLHDLFAVPFDEIAAIVDRSPVAARQLASRARRRIRAGARVPDADLGRQRAAVEAFRAAAREGDLDALVAVLDPDIVLRADLGPGGVRLLRGARTVAGQALAFTARLPYARPALVNGTAGMVVAAPGRPYAVLAFTVVHGRIAEIDILADPARLRSLLVSPSRA
jgi:RNA polymerase sigma-70 factor (ECF subfamily)